MGVEVSSSSPHFSEWVVDVQSRVGEIPGTPIDQFIEDLKSKRVLNIVNGIRKTDNDRPRERHLATTGPVDPQAAGALLTSIVQVGAIFDKLPLGEGEIRKTRYSTPQDRVHVVLTRLIGGATEVEAIAATDGWLLDPQRVWEARPLPDVAQSPPAAAVA